MARRRSVGQLLAAMVLASCCLAAGCGHEPVSVVLKYKVDPDAMPGGGAIDMDSLVEAVNMRLGGLGEAKAAGEQMVEVGVYGKVDQDQLDVIKRRVCDSGDLEFRITADLTHPDDRPIFEQAKLVPPNQTDVLLDGKKVAEWVTYSEGEFGPPDKQDSRIVKRMAGDTPQALVLMDPWNVTGQYLTSATKGVDERGGPAMNFSFNEQGAARFKQLTSRNKPNPATGAIRYLGILFDKRLISAPSIRTTTSNHGQISGGAMTEGEVDLMIRVLNTGRLPRTLREVSERPATK
jgi:preprotein translocase subunit SecD